MTVLPGVSLRIPLRSGDGGLSHFSQLVGRLSRTECIFIVDVPQLSVIAQGLALNFAH